ncbi:hypothetical protein D3C85_1015460 [compost metagenome]
MARHPGAQHGRHDARQRRGRGTQPQRACRQFRIRGRGPQVADIAQNAARAFKDADAGRRGLDGASRARDQRAAHIRLQRPQPLLHGGRRQSLMPRGLRNGAQLHHMHIGLKKTRIHGRSSLWKMLFSYSKDG